MRAASAPQRETDPASQTQGRLSAHPGRPPGPGLVGLPRETHPAGRSPRLVRRLGDAGPALPQARPPCPAASASTSSGGSPGYPPSGSRSPSAGSRRHGSWPGRNRPSASRPRPRAFPCPTATASGDSSTAIPNHRRLVPVPRRILRLLAGGCRPALIATILGHLIRCLYLKGGQCLGRGAGQGVVDRRHLRRRPAPRQAGAAGTHRHGMADPPRSRRNGR